MSIQHLPSANYVQGPVPRQRGFPIVPVPCQGIKDIGDTLNRLWKSHSIHTQVWRGGAPCPLISFPVVLVSSLQARKLTCKCEDQTVGRESDAHTGLIEDLVETLADSV